MRVADSNTQRSPARFRLALLWGRGDVHAELKAIWGRARAHRLRIAALAACVFALDTATEVDVVVPVLYVNVVLFATRSGRKIDVALAGWSSVGLTILSFALTLRPAVHFATALFNTGLSLLAILCVTILCLKNVGAQEEILRGRDRIARVARGSLLKTMSASIVHEVTRPLGAIGTSAEMVCALLSQAPPDIATTKIATSLIIDEVERASAVVSRLRGSMVPRKITCTLCDAYFVLERALDHLRFELSVSGANVRLLCPHDLRIFVDQELIEQAIVNAITNAIDALQPIDASQRQIWVEAKVVHEDIKIWIKDNGVGVDGTMFERIFDAFFTTKAGATMGTGLAVSKSIIEAHNGTIRALPNVPNGLVLELTLPAGTNRR